MSVPSTMPTLYRVAESLQEKRVIRRTELANKMKVILISDPTTDISAAALSVAAGSMHDPKKLSGLAHFHEHMLFLGTDMFPDENEYTKYLNEHGGSANAFTSQDETCYHFEVDTNSLDGALLRFAQFFIAPLFTPSMTEREVNAVHSEHEKNIPCDFWRLHQLIISFAKELHPYCNFATGNRTTLWHIPQQQSIDVGGALRDYNKNHYSSNLMNLVVLGKESVQELAAMVLSNFEDVPNKNLPLPIWPEHPYGPEELGYRINVVPLKDLRHLRLMFAIPDTSKDYATFSDGHLAHLIGHEGKGSLLSLLKKKAWVNNLAAGATALARGSAAFRIDMDLTPDGLINVDTIVEHVFQYIERIKRTTKEQGSIYFENRAIDKLFFEYQDKQPPQTFVTKLASDLHTVCAYQILSHGIEQPRYRQDVIDSILNGMKIENSLMIVVAKEFAAEANETEPYYGTKYSKEKISTALQKTVNEHSVHYELKLPTPNKFIPQNLLLKPRDEHTGIIPVLLRNTGAYTVWYLQDNEFQLPKGVIRFEIYSPLALSSTLNSNLNMLYVSAIKDALTEDIYAASLADLQVSITSTSYGMDITFHGFNCKLDTLLHIVVNKIYNLELTKERFDVLHESMVRALKNWSDDQPYLQAGVYMDYLLQDRKITHQERLKHVNEMTLHELKVYIEQFRKELKFEFVFCGNFTKQDCMRLVDIVDRKFAWVFMRPVSTVRFRELQLPPQSNFALQIPHQSSISSCAAVYFQCGLQTPRDNVMVELVELIASEACYSQLRTEEQLGYIVATHVRRSLGTHGLKILVQSSFHPHYVDFRIESFLKKFLTILQEMTPEQFQRNVEALITKKAERPKKIAQRAMQIWAEVSTQRYQFNRQEVEIEALRTINLPELIEYYEKYIAPGGSERKRLGIYILSDLSTEQPTEDSNEHIAPATFLKFDEVSTWKTTMPLYDIPPVVLQPGLYSMPYAFLTF